MTYGDVTDFTNFGGAVIDGRAFAEHAAALEMIRSSDACTVIAGGTADDSEGYFVRPTVVECSDPTHEIFTTEYFGPILGVHVFDDARFEDVVRQAESVAPYALTGSVFATDRRVDRVGVGGAALRGRQLLHQRQADRRGRRAAAVRRGARVGHQRQGGLVAEPGALDVAAHDQGDIRPADGSRVPAHGLSSARRAADPRVCPRAYRNVAMVSACPNRRVCPVHRPWIRARVAMV